MLEMWLVPLHKLGQIFDNDIKYSEDHTTFMNEIITKGYVKEVPREEVSIKNGH